MIQFTKEAFQKSYEIFAPTSEPTEIFLVNWAPYHHSMTRASFAGGGNGLEI
jgi:hypothetical protein